MSDFPQAELFARDVSPLAVAIATVRELTRRREGATKVQLAGALNADAADVLQVALNRLLSAGEIHAARIETGNDYAPTVFHAGLPEGVA